MTEKISDKQQQILDYINYQTQIKGYPPSVREICSAVGIKSTSTVHGYLERLQKKGYLQKDSSKTRALKVVDNSQKSNGVSEFLEVPIIGRVTAGLPILAFENVEGTFPLTMDFAKNSNIYMLKIKGDSMINAGIFDGDLVIVNEQKNANNGDIVIALIDDEATCKTFYKEKDYIRLQPENNSLEPIIVNEVSILGKVVGLFRKF